MKIENLKQSEKTINFLFLKSIIDGRIYFTLLLSFFITTLGFSQNSSKPIIPIVEVDSYLNTLKSSSQTTNYKKLESLLNDVQPSIYLMKGLVNTYGTRPICIYSDVTSFNLLNNNLPLTDEIELLTVKIQTPSDLKNQIDLSSVYKLKKLKYIYFQLNFDCRASDLSQFIKNWKENYIILYKIEKGA
jgi:hypothetical protein